MSTVIVPRRAPRRPSGRRVGAAAAAVLVLLGVSAAASDAMAGPSANHLMRVGIARDLNHQRTLRHLPPLHLTTDLSMIAQAEAARLAMAADPAGGTRVATLVRGYKVVGANVVYATSVPALEQAVMATTVQRSNVLDPGYTQLGVGAAPRAGRLWVVEVFRDPQIIGPLLRRGLHGQWVTTLQHALGVPVSGRFGYRTQAAVRRFQTAHQLRVTGIVDHRTWCALKL